MIDKKITKIVMATSLGIICGLVACYAMHAHAVCIGKIARAQAYGIYRDMARDAAKSIYDLRDACAAGRLRSIPSRFAPCTCDKLHYLMIDELSAEQKKYLDAIWSKKQKKQNRRLLAAFFIFCFFSVHFGKIHFFAHIFKNTFIYTYFLKICVFFIVFKKTVKKFHFFIFWVIDNDFMECQ